MSISFYYNGLSVLDNLKKLGGLAQTTDVTRNVGSSFNNTYQEQGSQRYGQSFMYGTLAYKPITVTLKLKGTQPFLVAAQEWLGGLLNVSEPKELIFGDEPNKIWLAIPTGAQSFAIDHSTSPASATVTLAFEVPSAYATSKTRAMVKTGQSGKYGTITKQSRSAFKAVLNNFGTAEVYPIITIKNNAENGYMGLVSASGIYELGNPEEDDSENIKRSELLLDYRFNLSSEGLRQASKNVAILNDTLQAQNGQVGPVAFNGRNFLSLSNWATNAGHSAGTLSWDIPTDSNGTKGSLNDYIWWRQLFWAGATNQYGFIKLSVSDTNGQFLYGVETYKRSNGLDCEYNFMASDGKGGYRMLKRWTFSATDIETQNPFNEPRGFSDLKRNDDKVQVYWWGSYPVFTIPEIKGRRSAKIHLAFGAIGNKPLVTRMYVEQLYYQKDFVAVARDIPNRYPMGSQMVIDMATGKTTLDGMPKNSDELNGSEPLALPVGTSELDFQFSSWLRKEPTITIEWKERYI
ncbi:distal tail protein Dit [Streptococcus sciuri]|uniref:Phage tail family protein n=1 Tax=Streptococcus sciuri TaxID=2973939 RepID=A0ABT2F7E8_9STRE|nr:distal tail protein Dit [Streptococcus sciuri]MCS4488373.1 phage tail family protein [Streptococcus sciuri]